MQGSQGTLLLDLVKGGRHFRCEIDVANGQAALSIDGLADWKRTAETSVRGPGKHRVMFANVDRQLLLWVDDKVVTFDEPTIYDELDNDRPRVDQRDGGDLAPLGIGSRGVAVDVSHLRVLRDIYYIADRTLSGLPITDYRDRASVVPLVRTDELVEFLSTPARVGNQPRRQRVRRAAGDRIRAGDRPVLCAGRQQPGQLRCTILAGPALRRSRVAGRQGAVRLLAASLESVDSDNEYLDSA